MKEAGNVVIFGSDDGDYVINKHTGIKTRIIDTGKDYVMRLHVPRTSKSGELNHVKSCGAHCNDGKCSGVYNGMWEALSGETSFPRHP